MNILVLAGAALVAFGAQWINRYPKIPAAAVKVGLALLALPVYGLASGWPHGWSGAPLTQWLDAGWLWVLALPGAASLFGALPNMGTNSAADTPAASGESKP